MRLRSSNLPANVTLVGTNVQYPLLFLLLGLHVHVSSSDDGGDACSLAKSRSRREKREKVGRTSALEQLKKAKRGEKIKYEVRNLSAV